MLVYMYKPMPVYKPTFWGGWFVKVQGLHTEFYGI